jgi:hypothetical protein
MYAVASYGYFVPQMPSFQSGGEGWTEAEIESFVRWWTGLNYVRMAIGGIGWLCALRRCRCRCRDLTRLGFRLLNFRRPASVGEVADDLEIADVVGEEGDAMDIRGSGDREVDRAPTWLAATAPHSG